MIDAGFIVFIGIIVLIVILSLSSSKPKYREVIVKEHKRRYLIKD